MLTSEAGKQFWMLEMICVFLFCDSSPCDDGKILEIKGERVDRAKKEACPLTQEALNQSGETAMFYLVLRGTTETKATYMSRNTEKRSHVPSTLP